MSFKVKNEEAYQIYKAMGLKRGCTQEFADMLGISRQTLYKYCKRYKWEERYLAETKESRENFETEIKNRIENGDLLIDVIRDDMLMKFAVTVKSDKFQPTLDDITKICELSIKNKNIKDMVNNTGNKDTGAKSKVEFSVSFADKEEYPDKPEV